MSIKEKFLLFCLFVIFSSGVLLVYFRMKFPQENYHVFAQLIGVIFIFLSISVMMIDYLKREKSRN